MAIITGVSLLVLVLVIMPVRYIGGNEKPSEYFSPFHGLMYFLYVLAAFDLVSRMRWSLWRLIKLMLAGCIPFLSFVAERRATREVEERLAQTAAKA
jgi:integral membrane protein